MESYECFQILNSWHHHPTPIFLPPCSYATRLPFTTRGCHFEACDLLSYIVWHTCIHVFDVKNYCIVSKCFANTLAERQKEDSVISCTAFASAKKKQRKNEKKMGKKKIMRCFMIICNRQQQAALDCYVLLVYICMLYHLSAVKFVDYSAYIRAFYRYKSRLGNLTSLSVTPDKFLQVFFKG